MSKLALRWLVGSALCGLLLCGCGEEGKPRKKTYPVTGEVYVDGKPASQLAVRCVSVQGIDKENPTTSSAFTDENGKFEISTYETADGVPEGEYILTFEWGQWNLVSGQYGGPDKLKGRYKDPKKSTVRFKVEGGKPVDLGRIELSTKGGQGGSG
ncbi:MAG TPA: hypothetical protein EYP56_00055 [Planctomycetaceae bacterium]|nr:hypothetical protein [Planctomycetaceae bacterium]